MLIYNGQVIAGGGTIVLPMTRAEYEANKAVLDTADVWVDLTDEPDQVATAEQIAYSVDNVQKSMGYIGDIATKAVAKVEPTDTALYLHAVGTYFINKDGNTCVTDVQIPVGGTITLGTNCHVCSDGVANDINSNLSKHTLGTAVSINTYIEGVNSYECLADGLFVCAANGNGTFEQGCINHTPIMSAYGTPDTPYEQKALNVRKGMLLTRTSSSSGGYCTFYPFV